MCLKSGFSVPGLQLRIPVFAPKKKITGLKIETTSFDKAQDFGIFSLYVSYQCNDPTKPFDHYG
jgi:hypothetical protein